MKLGIMQGRLVPPEAGRFQSFPRERWQDEFALAAAAGLDTIEWIYDAYGEDVNPIGSDAGVAELRKLSDIHGVGIESICADWFMEFPLIGQTRPEARTSRWQRLAWLMERGSKLNVNRVVIPFVDASAISSGQHVAEVVAGLNALRGSIDKTKVELHLETALAPLEFASLLAQLGHPGIKVNYDSGNSASLGYRPREEFAAYGERVGSVHLKDRRLGAGTVPFGDGDTDFGVLFDSLEEVGYRGDFVLQVARGNVGDELAWNSRNASIARGMLRRLAKA